MGQLQRAEPYMTHTFMFCTHTHTQCCMCINKENTHTPTHTDVHRYTETQIKPPTGI